MGEPPRDPLGRKRHGGVYMDLAVTNISHKGSRFIPQNALKIIVGDNEFDAADLEGDGES
jgi:hypothetical protein